MTHDTGFAPNPFHGYCTLAACTPNHQRANLNPGDIIVGYEGEGLKKSRKRSDCETPEHNALIYYMVIDEILDLDKYFRDSRFQVKKPIPGSRKPIQRVGDNAYYKDKSTGSWNWIHGHCHNLDKCKDITTVIKQDTKGDRVFIGRNFYYFGNRAVSFPNKFIKYLPQRGIKYCRHPLSEFDRYVKNKAEELGGRQKRLGDPIEFRTVGGRGG
jgi:hypothetical protein